MLPINSIDRLSKVFSVPLISKVKDIMSEIVKVVFKPSNRQIWMKLGTDKDYIMYPRVYCSCMDFFLQGNLIQNSLIKFPSKSTILETTDIPGNPNDFMSSVERVSSNSDTLINSS